MKKKPKSRNKWKRYEWEKQALARRGLSPAAYEKAVKELSKKLRL